MAIAGIKWLLVAVDIDAMVTLISAIKHWPRSGRRWGFKSLLAPLLNVVDKDAV